MLLTGLGPVWNNIEVFYKKRSVNGYFLTSKWSQNPNVKGLKLAQVHAQVIPKWNLTQSSAGPMLAIESGK